MTRHGAAGRGAIAALIVLAGIGTLAGCGTDSGGVVNTAVQSASGGDVTLGGSLPSGWPAEVPVIDGELLFGAGSGATADATAGATADTAEGWVVTVKASSSDPLSEARRQLEDAGFTVDASAQGTDGGVVSMKNDHYTVVLAGTADGLLYTVTPIK